jgi:hypothetical protein
MIARITELSTGQWVARVLIATMPVATLLCAGAAGARLPAWLVVLVVLVGAGWAVVPESTAGVAVLAIIVVWWGIELGSAPDPLVLPAAAALLTAHVAALLDSYGPATMALDRDVVILWLRRGALVYLMAPALYGFATWVEDVPEPAGLWPAGLAVTAAAAVVVGSVIARQAYADPGSYARPGPDSPRSYEGEER